jgi:hypothetical protein
MARSANKCMVLVVAGFAAWVGTAAVGQGFPGGISDALGPRFSAPTTPGPLPRGRGARTNIAHWTEVAIDASGLDHTPVAEGDPRIYGEQLGPARASRAVAIVSIAVFEAANAVDRRYRSFVDLPRARPGTSLDAATAQAAHDALVAMFPSQQGDFDAELERNLERIHGRPRELGVALGREAARIVVALRANDGAKHDEPRIGSTFFPQDGAGSWRPDPVSQLPLALGASWSHVKPFVMQSSDQFRVPPPPALASAQYAIAYNEVKALGGDGVATPTIRSSEQTDIGIFWAYDGMPSLCAPPRLYNQIAMQVARQMGTEGVDLARLLALVNTSLADAAIAAWESKYFYQVWRPVTGVREADAGTGPTGPGDANPATAGDASFVPLGAPASNLTGPNFTPPFPAYPSGHAAFGGALFETLRQIYGRDDIAFTFMSDEMNGVTKDHDGNVRPIRPRTFSSLSQAEEENAQSRIYLGIHWAFDKTEGIAQGRRIARHVIAHAFGPVF